MSATASTPPPHPMLAPVGPGEGKDEMSRGLRWSLLFHVTLFAFIIFKALVFPGEAIPFIPALRVDIVGLPDVLKRDLSKIPKTPAPEAEAKPKPAAPVPPPPVAKPKAPPKTMAEPDEMVLKPASPQQEKTREKKMKSALDRIKALEKINDEVNAKPAAAQVKGNKVSKGASLSPDARESAQNSYYDTVRDSLQSNWALPPWIARQQLDAKILVRIDATGHVLSLTFMKSSGNPQFDTAVKKAVADSQPFPAPPDAILDEVSSRGIQVGFPL